MFIKKCSGWIGRHIVGLMVLFLLLHASVPILSPIAFRLGAPGIGRTIQYVYKYLCHQRVDRSLFLFSQIEGLNSVERFAKFYTVQDLQEYGVIPRVNPYAPVPAWSETFFGYPYYGNELVGYKVAYCIRDTALYSALSITAFLLYVWFKVMKRHELSVPYWVYGLLMLPMAVDGVFQMIAEGFHLVWVPDWYFTNNLKRIVTGVLFGVGFGVAVISSLKKSTDILYNELDGKKDAV